MQNSQNELTTHVSIKELIDLKDIRLFLCELEFASIDRVVSDLIGWPINRQAPGKLSDNKSKTFADVVTCWI